MSTRRRDKKVADEEDDPDAMLQTIVIPRADPNGMQTLEDAQKAIAAQAAKYAAANPRPARKEPLSTKDFERVRGAITQWARLKTFVPSDIGFQIEVVDWDDEHASRVTIEVGSSARTATGAVPKLEELDYRGELPRSLLRGVRGKRELEDKTSWLWWRPSLASQVAAGHVNFLV